MEYFKNALTGFFTHSGHEMREGDLFKHELTYENSNDFPYYLVIYDKETGKFQSKELKGMKYNMDLYWIKHSRIYLGNINDNPNLLKENGL